jgi:NarL family two-component system sensor histidine kinase LiaS
MSVVNRQVLFTLFLTFSIMIVTTSVTFFVFPFDHLSLLWEKEIIGLPYIVSLLGLSLVIGVLSGLLFGLGTKNELKSIFQGLKEIENGRRLNSLYSSKQTDVFMIQKEMERISERWSEQRKASQKLMNERAEEQEKRIQSLVSKERNRLARELHDSVSQQLFAASMMMSAISESAPENNPYGKQLKLVEGMIQQSQLEMRALLLHLRPVALKGKTLEEGIQELLSELSQKVPMSIRWTTESIPMYKGMEDHLFRILQESISNTLRHAKASSLEVSFMNRDGLLILSVIDDGIGFDIEKEKTGSYGLQNMNERAIEMGGSLKIVSLANEGTKLEVRVPIERTKDKEQ